VVYAYIYEELRISPAFWFGSWNHQTVYHTEGQKGSVKDLHAVNFGKGKGVELT
jgi:hypothetical protein